MPMTGPAGQSLAVSEVQITADGAEVRLHFQLTWTDWLRVDQGGWFHLAPDVRGPIFGGSLLEGMTIEIEARATDSVAATLLSQIEDIYDVAANLVATQDSSQARSTEGWYALNVKQERRPGVKTGFATHHAN